MNKAIASVKKLEKRTLLYFGAGLFLLVSGLSEFLPNFNGPVGMLLIAFLCLYLGFRAAKRNLAEFTP